MKRPGGAERRCGGAAPALFDAPHAPPINNVWSAPPGSPLGNKAAPPFKGSNPQRRSTSPRLSLLFPLLRFSSSLCSLSSSPSVLFPLLLVSSLLYPSSSLVPSSLFSTSISSLLLLIFFFHYIFSLSFLTSFPFLCFVSCPPIPYLLPHLLFPSLYLLSLLLISSLVSFLPHLYPPSLISCFLIPLSFSVTMSSFFSFPPPHLNFPLALLLLMHSPPFLPMLFLLSHPFFQLYFTVLISSSPTFSLNSPSVILSLQLLSLSSSLPSSLLSPFPFYLPLFPLPPSPSCHGCMSASLICGLSAGPCYPPDGALFLG